MKKTLFTIALLALMLFATSAYNNDNAGTRIGDFAPDLTLTKDNAEIELNQLRGNYVLLTFWKSADAASRVNCNKYDAWVNANSPKGLSHVAVNLDQETTLFEEVVKRDGLNMKAQYNVQGQDADRVVRDFRLANGLGSMLIGPDGRIVSYNPTNDELSSLN